MAAEEDLSDEVVTLRPADEHDLIGIDAGIHDADVVRWLGSPPGTAADVLELNRRRAIEGSPTFAVRDRADRFLGLAWINRSAIDPVSASVGYWLLPEARGQGYATRSVRLLVDHARRNLRLRRLVLIAEPANARSRQVAERAGFEPVATRSGSDEIDGRSIDVVVYVHPLDGR